MAGHLQVEEKRRIVQSRIDHSHAQRVSNATNAQRTMQSVDHLAQDLDRDSARSVVRRGKQCLRARYSLTDELFLTCLTTLKISTQKSALLYAPNFIAKDHGQ